MSVKEWISEHKEGIIWTIGCMGVFIAGVYYRKEIQNALLLLNENINSIIGKPSANHRIEFDYVSPSIPAGAIDLCKRVNVGDPFPVSAHNRKLARGMHASPEKVATAMENGFILGPGETWVQSYNKNRRFVTYNGYLSADDDISA